MVATFEIVGSYATWWPAREPLAPTGGSDRAPGARARGRDGRLRAAGLRPARRALPDRHDGLDGRASGRSSRSTPVGQVFTIVLILVGVGRRALHVQRPHRDRRSRVASTNCWGDVAWNSRSRRCRATSSSAGGVGSAARSPPRSTRGRPRARDRRARPGAASRARTTTSSSATPPRTRSCARPASSGRRRSSRRSTATRRTRSSPSAPGRCDPTCSSWPGPAASESVEKLPPGRRRPGREPAEHRRGPHGGVRAAAPRGRVPRRRDARASRSSSGSRRSTAGCGSPIAGRSLRDDAPARPDGRAGPRRCARQDGTFQTNPSPDTEIRAGQVIIAIGTQDRARRAGRGRRVLTRYLSRHARSNGSRQVCGAMTWWMALGPHEPGAYGRTGGGSVAGDRQLPQPLDALGCREERVVAGHGVVDEALVGLETSRPGRPSCRANWRLSLSSLMPGTGRFP